jgi:hypothetical protein
MSMKKDSYTESKHFYRNDKGRKKVRKLCEKEGVKKVTVYSREKRERVLEQIR